jgi:hypothetical protein
LVEEGTVKQRVQKMAATGFVATAAFTVGLVVQLIVQ